MKKSGRRRLRAAAPPIGEKGLSRQNGSFMRVGSRSNDNFGRSISRSSIPRTASRNLGIDDRIDDKAVSVGCSFDGNRGTREPAHVLSSATSRRTLLSIRRSHYASRVSAIVASVLAGDIATPSQMCDKSGPRPSQCEPWRGRCRTALPSSSNSTLRVRQKARPLAISAGMVTWRLDVIRITLPLTLTCASKEYMRGLQRQLEAGWPSPNRQ